MPSIGVAGSYTYLRLSLPTRRFCSSTSLPVHWWSPLTPDSFLSIPTGWAACIRLALAKVLLSLL